LVEVTGLEMIVDLEEEWAIRLLKPVNCHRKPIISLEELHSFLSELLNPLGA